MIKPNLQGTFCHKSNFLLTRVSLSQAADILSSAPAMQIRYLEAMQAMAKSANSKVIFLPGPSQSMSQSLAVADHAGEGPSKYQSPATAFDNNDDEGFQRAINARVVENI
jgi:hypothetical protein